MAVSEGFFIKSAIKDSSMALHGGAQRAAYYCAGAYLLSLRGNILLARRTLPMPTFIMRAVYTDPFLIFQPKAKIYTVMFISQSHGERKNAIGTDYFLEKDRVCSDS
jgi:hypothetical protein